MAQSKVRFSAFIFDDPTKTPKDNSKVYRDVCTEVKQRLNEEKSIAGGAEAWRAVGRRELYLNQEARMLCTGFPELPLPRYHVETIPGRAIRIFPPSGTRR